MIPYYYDNTNLQISLSLPAASNPILPSLNLLWPAWGRIVVNASSLATGSHPITLQYSNGNCAVQQTFQISVVSTPNTAPYFTSLFVG
jgi:hypothetical protein